jgi:hypothetical protein
MKRKWPGVTQHLRQLNNGLREVYNGWASDIRQIVRDAEKGYNRGTFDKVLKALAMDYSGYRGPDDPLFEKFSHGGFLGIVNMSVELVKNGDYSNVTYGTLHVRFGKPGDVGNWSYDFLFPVRYKTDSHDIASLEFCLPEFFGVDYYDGEVLTAKYDKCIERMKKLYDDLKRSINILIRAVMGENKERRYKVRDALNLAAEKYGIKEAIYEEGE